jgi:tetratricopeptide (TPR) repeat protein
MVAEGSADVGGLHLQRALALIDLGRPEAALDEAGRGLARDPQNAQLHVVRSKALRELGRLPEAHHAGQLAVAADPTSCATHRNMGWVFFLEGNLPMARYAADNALRIAPDDVSARYLSVVALSRQGYAEPARRLAAGLVQDVPDQPIGYLAVAQAELGQLRRLDFARPWVLVVVVLVSRGAALIGLLVWWLILWVRNRGPLRRADRAMHEALRLAPDDPAVLTLTAQVLARQGRRYAAADRMVRAGRSDPTAVDAARLGEQLGNYQAMTEAVIAVLAGLTVLATCQLSRLAGWIALVVSTLAAIGIATLPAPPAARDPAARAAPAGGARAGSLVRSGGRPRPGRAGRGHSAEGSAAALIPEPARES